jgi:myo-inositol catabolism protein IolS
MTGARECGALRRRIDDWGTARLKYRMDVEKAALGRTGIEVSRLCIGGMQTGRASWDDEGFVAMLRRALSAGLNFVDTAPAYGDGRSEALVGKAIKGHRHQVLIATKFSFLCERPADIRLSLEESLRRLGTDYVDVLQQHWPSLNIPVAETIGELERLKAEGKIRALGVSNWMEPEWDDLNDPSRIDSLQPCHSVLWRSIEPRVLPLCRRHGIAVIPYSPLCQGLLTGRFRNVSDLVTTTVDTRYGNQRLKASDFLKIIEIVDLLEEVGRKYGKTPAQTALRWLLDQPGVTSVIVGGSRIDQLAENLGALDWHLDSIDWERLSQATWQLSNSLGPHDTLRGWHPKKDA